jgi:hypothetical protein
MAGAGGDQRRDAALPHQGPSRDHPRARLGDVGWLERTAPAADHTGRAARRRARPHLPGALPQRRHAARPVHAGRGDPADRGRPSLQGRAGARQHQCGDAQDDPGLHRGAGLRGSRGGQGRLRQVHGQVLRGQGRQSAGRRGGRPDRARGRPALGAARDQAQRRRAELHLQSQPAHARAVGRRSHRRRGVGRRRVRGTCFRTGAAARCATRCWRSASARQTVARARE